MSSTMSTDCHGRAAWTPGGSLERKGSDSGKDRARWLQPLAWFLPETQLPTGVTGAVAKWYLRSRSLSHICSSVDDSMMSGAEGILLSFFVARAGQGFKPPC